MVRLGLENSVFVIFCDLCAIASSRFFCFIWNLSSSFNAHSCLSHTMWGVEMCDEMLLPSEFRLDRLVWVPFALIFFCSGIHSLELVGI
jgi:hypothetical protein